MWPRPKMNEILERIQRDYYTSGPPPHDFDWDNIRIDTDKDIRLATPDNTIRIQMPVRFLWVCGKGHEQSMCFGVIEYAWDDVEATRTALDAFLTGRPMPDLGLPTFNELNLSAL